MATKSKQRVFIRSATVEDVDQLQTLYMQQYPQLIQQEHKSIAKYIKKALNTDLKDIHKHYLIPPEHGLWVAFNSNNPNIIIGMIGIRQNKSWNSAKQNTLNRHDKKPNFRLAYNLIDEMIQLLMTNNIAGAVNHIEAEIVRFGVSKAWRRKGVGTILLNHAKQFCANNGYQRIIASTMSVLDDAIYFYKSVGFKLKDTEPCGKDQKLQFLRFTLNLVNL